MDNIRHFGLVYECRFDGGCGECWRMSCGGFGEFVGGFDGVVGGFGEFVGGFVGFVGHFTVRWTLHCSLEASLELLDTSWRSLDSMVINQPENTHFNFSKWVSFFSVW